MNDEKPALTVREAGRLGGQKTKERHGPEFFKANGLKGGNRVKELLAKGKAVEAAENHD